MEVETPKTSRRQRIKIGYETLLKEVKNIGLRVYNSLDELFTERRQKALLKENELLSNENDSYKGRLENHRDVILQQKRKIEGAEERVKQSKLEIITIQKEHESLKQEHKKLQIDNSSLKLEGDAYERLLANLQGRLDTANGLVLTQRRAQAKATRRYLIRLLEGMPEDATSISGVIDSSNNLLAASPSFYKLSGYEMGEELNCNEILEKEGNGFLTFSQEQPWARIILKTKENEKTLMGCFFPNYVGTAGKGRRLNFTYFYMEPPEGIIRRACNKLRRGITPRERIPKKIQEIILESDATLNPAMS